MLAPAALSDRDCKEPEAFVGGWEDRRTRLSGVISRTHAHPVHSSTYLGGGAKGWMVTASGGLGSVCVHITKLDAESNIC